VHRHLQPRVSICRTSVNVFSLNLQVGMKGGVGPWTLTHSLFSAVLLNVQSTMKHGALYPAKAYHEDVDFPHICEDNQLVAVKCQWLFVHKVRNTPICYFSLATMTEFDHTACLAWELFSGNACGTVTRCHSACYACCVVVVGCKQRLSGWLAA